MLQRAVHRLPLLCVLCQIMHPSTTGLPGQASSAELRAHTADGETDAAIDDKTFCGTAEYVGYRGCA